MKSLIKKSCENISKSIFIVKMLNKTSYEIYKSKLIMKILINTIMIMAPLLIKATRSPQGLHESALKY